MFKLKSLLTYCHSENPSAYKQINKHTLSVYYRSNSKSWITQALFKDWNMNCFFPHILEYCLEKGIPFKILLILDNALGHPSHLTDLHSDTRTFISSYWSTLWYKSGIFTSKYNNPPIQPMVQGVTVTFQATFKLLHVCLQSSNLQTMFAESIAATDIDKNLTQ